MEAAGAREVVRALSPEAWPVVPPTRWREGSSPSGPTRIGLNAAFLLPGSVVLCSGLSSQQRTASRAGPRTGHRGRT